MLAEDRKLRGEATLNQLRSNAQSNTHCHYQIVVCARLCARASIGLSHKAAALREQPSAHEQIRLLDKRGVQPANTGRSSHSIRQPAQLAVLRVNAGITADRVEQPQDTMTVIVALDCKPRIVVFVTEFGEKFGRFQ